MGESLSGRNAEAHDVPAPNLGAVRAYLTGEVMPYVGKNLRLSFDSHLLARDEGRLSHVLQGIKAPGSVEPTSSVDLDINRIIQTMLLNKFPNIPYISEESLDGPSRDKRILSLEPNYLKSLSWLWVVDPKDGTGRFLKHSSRFSTSIGLFHFGEPVVGAVHSPMEGKDGTTWSAQADVGGARKNDREIYVSKTDSIDKADLSVAYAWNGDHRSRNIVLLEGTSLSIRQPGHNTASSVLDIIEVAEGTLDGHYSVGLKLWDKGAAPFIAEQAGGKGTGDVFRDEDTLVVTNGQIHDELLGRILEAEEAHERKRLMLEWAERKQRSRFPVSLSRRPRFGNLEDERSRSVRTILAGARNALPLFRTGKDNTN